MVFHDVTHSMSVSGKVLEKADMDFFHSSNANYSCHVFKPFSRSKGYHVQGMKEDNLDIYSLPTRCFDQADILSLVISSLPFRIHFFQFLPTLQPVPLSCPFLLFSSFISHPLQEADANFFSSFFMCMPLLSCALHLLVERLNCCRCFSNSNSVSLPPCSALP